MQLEHIDINIIVEYDNNAKQHPSWHINQIKDSILEFGYNDPIAIDENNIIIEGHGRFLALKELGFQSIDVIRLTHLSQNQKEAYIIAHNRICLNTNFDFNKLKTELEFILKNENIDLSKYGVEFKKLDDISQKTTLNNNVVQKKVLKCPNCKQEQLKSKYKEVLNV